MNVMEASPSLLVIDDEDSICLAFRRFFEPRGWTVRVAASARAGLAAYRQFPPTVVFLDVRLPDRSGLELLSDLGGGPSGVIVITAYGGFDTVVHAIQGKADDYLVKPIDLDKAFALADQIRETRLRSGTPSAGNQNDKPELLVGDSPCMQEVYKRIARVAAATAPVLIEGPTGTGKELAARAIHQLGPRRGAPFVAFNCGAIPESLIESELFGHVRGAFTGAETDRTGRFESAAGGCVLLDEIGELPLATQVKLLRILDDGRIERVGSSKTIPLDVRVLAATNRNLTEEVERGRFRRDLYFRLAVLRISLPPLQERKQDLPSLAAHFLRLASAPDGAPPELSADALRELLRHDWPGNVRELRSAMEHALTVAPGRTILPDDLPESVRRAGGVEAPDEKKFHAAVIEYAARLPGGVTDRCHRTLRQAERALILHALKRHGGNQSEAADYLGVHRNTLRGKLRELGFDAQEGGPKPETTPNEPA